MKNSTHVQDALRRAALPELLRLPDLSLALGLPEETVELYASTGRLGRCLLIAGKPAILREDFLATLAARAASTAEKELLAAPRRDVGPEQEVRHGNL